MKRNTLIKIVGTIIVLELLIGGVFFAYKKLKQKDDNSISTKNKTVQELYKKIAHEDLDIPDVMSNEAMLYYAYWNLNNQETISCDVVEIEEKVEDYNCEGIVPFASTKDLKKQVKELYGKDVLVEVKSFPIDDSHYGYFDKKNKGIVVYERKSNTSPINIKLKKAEKDENEIKLTTQVLDGIYGKVLHTYRYTFEKEDKNYYLKKKEKVTED